MREDIKKIYLDNKDLFWGRIGITDIYGKIVDELVSSERKFYIYEWFTKDENKVFYVGKGTGDRFKHIISDIKSKAIKGVVYKELLDNYGIDVRIVMDDLTDIESQIYEIYLINKRCTEGEVLLQLIDMPNDMEEDEADEYYKTFINRTFEPKIEISNYRKRYFGIIEEPKYDEVEEAILLNTHFLFVNDIMGIGKGIEEEKLKIEAYVESKKGKIFSTLAKSVVSVIEFGILDYDKYYNLKQKGYKIYHSFYVLDYINKKIDAPIKIQNKIKEKEHMDEDLSVSQLNI